MIKPPTTTTSSVTVWEPGVYRGGDRVLFDGVEYQLRRTEVLQSKNFTYEASLGLWEAAGLGGAATEASQLIEIAELQGIEAQLVALNNTQIDILQSSNDVLSAIQDTTEVTDEPVVLLNSRGTLIQTVRTDSDMVLADAEFDAQPIQTNDEGRVKVSTKPAKIAITTGNITAIQPTVGTPVAGATVICDVERASNVVMYCSGTFSAVNCIFEACIEPTGERWFTIQAVRSNANTIETTTGSLSAAPIYSWEMSVNGYSRVRVRATARTSGTQVWAIKPGVYATEPIPASQVTSTQPVSGTVTANNGTAGGAANNDSTTALGAGATFLGTIRDLGATLGAYNNIRALFYADVDSAALGAQLLVSPTTTPADFQPADAATFTAASGKYVVLTAPASYRYYRLSYTNGGVAQTLFRASSIASRI